MVISAGLSGWSQIRSASTMTVAAAVAMAVLKLRVVPSRKTLP